MRRIPVFLSLLPILVGHAQPATQQTGSSYDELRLYNETSEHSSFNVEVMRGMAFGFGTGGAPETLYAIHSYQSSVVNYDLPSSPSGVYAADNLNRWKTITDPVAIAVTDDHVFVLGQGSHALAKHRRDTGDIVDVMMLTAGKPNAQKLKDKRLGSEPADMVLNSLGDTAYISLMGADAVVEVNLTSMTENRRWQPEAPVLPNDLMWKRPRFLALDEGNNALYVAPFLSGNDTFTVRDSMIRGDGEDQPTGLATAKIITKSEVTVGLPDRDLFKVNLTSGDVVPVVTEAGSLLTAHGVHGSEYWMVGIESLNAAAESEPENKGNFARNVLSRNMGTGFISVANPSGPPENGMEYDLDDPTDMFTYTSSESIPFPYAMEFGGPAGVTAIASSTLSRIALYSASGGSRTLINLEDATDPDHQGEVIRSLAFTPNGDLYIYCQETSSIVVWPVDATGVAAGDASHSFFLGDDPTATRIAEGRRQFYNAKKSADHRFTCATCHPGGESDILNWELKDGLADFKDPMLTQTLKGLRETFPYHWRGERNLSEFNGAFHELLGEEAVSPIVTGFTDDDLAAFEDFIFSLRPAANPHALIERTMQRNYHPLGSDVAGSTADGLESYKVNGGQAGTCFDCHPLPTGGMGLATSDTFAGNRHGLSTNANMETVQLSNLLQAREQPLYPLVANGVTFERSILGSGFRHDSGEDSIFGFIENVFPGIFPTPAMRGEIAAFIQAMDTSTPPGVHAAVHWAGGGDTDKLALIGNLLDQADEGWIDVVAFGLGPVAGAGQASADLSWVYLPGTTTNPGVWRPDDRYNAALIARDRITDFAASDVTFLGAPDGQGERLGVDYDNDQIVNKDEALSATDPWVTDDDGDGYPDGYEAYFLRTGPDVTPPAFVVQPFIVPNFTNGSTALVKFTTNEPVTWLIKATPMEGGVQSTRFEVAETKGTTFGRVHTAHIHGIGPSFFDEDVGSNPTAADLMWDVELSLKDLSGNDLLSWPVLVNNGPMPATEVLFPNITPGVVVDNLAWAQGQPLGMVIPGVFRGSMDLRLRRYSDASNADPLDELIVIAQVQKKGPLANDPWVAVPNNQLRHNAPNFVLPNTVNPIVGLSEVVMGTSVTTPTDYSTLIGPSGSTPLMVLGESDVNGDIPRTTVVVFGFTAGEEVRIQIVGVTEKPGTYTPSAPVFGTLEFGFNEWIMPLTPSEKRALKWPIL